MRQPLSRHRLTAELTMQTSSDKKVYGITQQNMRQARAAFKNAAPTVGGFWAYALVMQMLRDTYDLRKQGK